MGNSFSGRWQYHSRKLTVEECLRVDVNKLYRQGEITQGMQAIEIKPQQTVTLTWTSCTYGSQRPWFECPKCKRRAGKLFSPVHRQRYLCRTCWGLSYKICNQSGDDFDVAIARIERLKRKLNAPRDLIAPVHTALLIPKPKGMHWKTYSRIMKECLAAEDAMAQALHNDFLSKFQFF